MSIKKHLIASLLFYVSLTSTLTANVTQAPFAYLFDSQTNTVLFERNADQLMPPASMTKMMTIYMLFDAIKKGKVSLNDEFTVSEKAWRKGGTKMFVEVGKKVKVEDLIRGVIVQSGNDACIVIAEALGQDEDYFAQLMTQKARDLGLKKSTFKNASGWPHPDHKVTAKELGMLAAAIIKDFPEYYHYFAETTFTYNNIKQYNRNRLLGNLAGADGLKTGHTEEAGYGLTASAKRGEQRLIAVVNGLADDSARIEEAKKLLSWGFQEFENVKLFQKGQKIDEVNVWAGEANTIDLSIDEDTILTLPRGSQDKLKIKLQYTTPLPAPINKGDVIAHLDIILDKKTLATIPLQAHQNIAELGFFAKKWYGLKQMFSQIFTP